MWTSSICLFASQVDNFPLPII
uniref:Uncharacterized protein n=1 Tax=Rhizophora mucronata TaxID=61149 RepID=A0A2P2Q0H2_RHIMU